MSVKVQGETYESPAEIVDAIGRLEAQYQTMPDGQERANLLTHIERLRGAIDEPVSSEAAGLTDGEPTDAGRKSRPQKQEPSTSNDDDDEPELEGAEPVCPMCNGDGVLAVEPPEHPDFVRCEDCKGYGKVYTGSRVPGHDVADCPTCLGQGYTKKAPTVTPMPIPQMTRAETPQAPGATLSEDQTRWLPPSGQQPPWEGATWDEFYGAWR